MQGTKAVFLDRDGVLIHERGEYTWLLEDMKINEGVFAALERFSRAGYLLIVISNQGGIGRGLYTKQEVEYLHLHLERQLELKGIRLTEIYFCPHHPVTSKCLCRKPESLMLEKAIARYGIDPKISWFIGDSDRDIEAGTKAGLRCLRIDVNGSLGAAAEKVFSQNC